jgi:phage replication O-like protein O
MNKGFAMTPNDILDALAKNEHINAAGRIILVIIRKTMGYNTDIAKIELNEFCSRSGLKKEWVCKTLKKLESAKIIRSVKTGGYFSEYGLERDILKWAKLSKSAMKFIVQKCNDSLSKSAMNPNNKNNKNNTPYNPPQASPAGEFSSNGKGAFKEKGLKHTFDACVDCILHYFNSVGATHYPVHFKGLRRKVRQRLREGATIRQVKEVIEFKYWDFIGKHVGKDGKYRPPNNETDTKPFYNPSTIFKAENFARYLGEAREDYFERKKQLDLSKKRKQREEKNQKQELNKKSSWEREWPGHSQFCAALEAEMQAAYGPAWMGFYADEYQKRLPGWKKQKGYI